MESPCYDSNQRASCLSVMEVRVHAIAIIINKKRRERNTCVDQDQEFWFGHTKREKREKM